MEIKFLKDLLGYYDIFFPKDSVRDCTIIPSNRPELGSHYLVQGHGYGIFINEGKDFEFTSPKVGE